MDVDLLNNFTEAISNGRTDVVRTLIEFCGKGFEDGNENSKEKNLEGLLNSTCSPFGTPLHLATKLNQVDIVRTLLSAGADPSAQNSNGDSAYDLVTSERMTTVYVEELMMCAAHSDSKRIYQLIVAGVGVNSIDSPTSGNTPLHWAASFGNEDIIQLLLDNEASVNARNAYGATPLHDAVDRGNLEIVKKLLKGGANPLCKGNKCKYAGKTPIDLAAGSKEITDLLCFSPLHDASNSECQNGSISSQALSSDVNILENGLSSSLSHLSLLSDDFPVKHSMDSYASPMPSVNLMPHLTSPPPLITDSKLHLLWPQPQKIAQTGDELFNMKEIFSVQIFHGFYETSSHDIISVWNNHESNFLSMGIKCAVEDVITSLGSMQADIVCSVNSSLLDRPGSYKVTITATQIKISFSNLLGLHYALCTVEQLFRLFKCEGIPLLYIHDWPMFQCRAALLDMSFGARIPNMETLKECLRILSSLKIRQVHFYITIDIETPNKRPYVSRDLIEYAGYCQQYYLNPVPTIDVAPDVCIEDLMHFQLPVQNMMSLFSSAEIHLGPCLSKIIMGIILKEKNIDIMCKLLPSYSQFLVYLCFDGISKNMELLELLPPNVVIVEYGFQTEHDFDFSMQTVTHKGLTTCIGVGTSAWNSFAGCPDTAINNIHTASQVALSHNGHGLIAMDWSGSSHHTAMCFSWPGLVLTAGLAWNPSVHVDYLQRRLPELLNQHIILDPEEVTGYLLVELGRLEAYIHRASFDANNKSVFNLECKGSILHQLLVDPDSVLVEYLKLDSFHQAICHLKKFEMDLHKAKPSCFQMEEVTAELQLAIDLLIFSCRLGKLLITTGRNPSNSGGVAVINVGMANLPATSRTDLANRLLALTEQFRDVWLSRNLPCGLHSSLFLFNKLLHKLIPENNNYLYQSDGLQKQKLFVI